MTKQLRIIEKITAWILISWGLFSLIISFWSMNSMYNFWFYRLDNSWQELSLFKVSKNYILPLFIPIFTFISGYRLLSNKKKGWNFAVVMLIFQSIKFISILFTFELKENYNGETMNEVLFYSLSSIIPLVFLTLFILLLSKPFRIKYPTTKNTYFLMFGLFVLLLMIHFI